MFEGKPITGWKSYDIARVGIARTFQIPKPYRQLSVVENVMLSAFLREKSLAGARRLAEATLADVGLADYAGTPASSLTVGLLKRLEVARALAMRPKLVLFDEIMAGLTPTEVGAMTKFVAALPARGITVIWVEHVLYAIMKTATRMIVINRGEADRRGHAGGDGAPSRGREGLSRRGDGPCLRSEISTPSMAPCRCCTTSICRSARARSSDWSAPMPPARAR